MAIVQSQYTLINLRWETQLWGGMRYLSWSIDAQTSWGHFFLMGHPLENRFTYFNHQHQKPVTRGKRRINVQLSVHLVRFSPWVPWDVCSVYQKADEQYMLVSLGDYSMRHALGLSPSSLMMFLSPRPRQMQNQNNTDLSGCLFIFFFPVWLCISFITIFSLNKTKHVCRSSNTFCISLYHFHLLYLQVFPSLRRKVTCIFSVKNPC